MYNMKRYIKSSTYPDIVTQILKTYGMPDYDKPNVYYHNTRMANVPGILQKGLLVDNTRNEDGSIWCTNKPYKQTYGGVTIAFNLNGISSFEQVNNDEFIIHDDIPLNNIEFIDYIIVHDDYGDIYKLSDLPKLIAKFGTNKVIKVLSRFKNVECDIANLVKSI